MTKKNMFLFLVLGIFIPVLVFFFVNITIGQTKSLQQTNPTPPAQAPAQAPAVAATPTPFYYTVAKGDTFNYIAAIFGISIIQLQTANPNIKPDKISTGMLLKIPSGVNPASLGLITPNPNATQENVANILFAPPTPITFPEINTFKDSARFTFYQLGERTFSLSFPSAKSLYFDLPNQWIIQYGMSFIDIHYDLYDMNTMGLLNPYYYSGYGPYRQGKPLADVYINNMLVGEFLPAEGKDNIVRLYFPTTLLNERQYNDNNDYKLTIQYYQNNDTFCGYTGILTIHEDSSINLQFTTGQAYLDLANFPVQIVGDSFLPETLPIIIPDDYSESDLSAAANVSVAIGRKVNTGNIKLKVLKASEVKLQSLVNSNAILIGQTNKNSLIKSLYDRGLLPTKLNLQGLTIDPVTGLPAAPEDGVLQLVRSDIKDNYTFLIITGNSDKAIERAVKALINPPIGMRGTLSIIRVDPTLSVQPAIDDAVDSYFFSQLRFQKTKFYGLEESSAYLSIYVPRTWKIEDPVELYINYDHSANLNLKASALSVELNGNPVGAIPLDMTPGEKQIAIPIRSYDLQPGMLNTFRFIGILNSELVCTGYDPTAFWVSINDTSVIRIPHRILTTADNLPPFIHPIFYLTNSPNIFISLPPDPKADELEAMADLLLQLGRQMSLPTYYYTVSVNPNIDPTTQITSNAIIIGKPTRNPLLGKINDQLPQPFVPGEDNLTIKQKLGSYRVLQDRGLGLVQVMPVPWNPLNGITVVTGTNDDGFIIAAKKLPDPNYLYDFMGDLFFIQDNRIDSFASTKPMIYPVDVIVSKLTGQQATLVPVQATSVLTIVPSADRYIEPTQGVVAKDGTAIAKYLMIGIIGVGIVVLVLAIYQTVRGGRRR
jgi:hypothetical protein